MTSSLPRTPDAPGGVEPPAAKTLRTADLITHLRRRGEAEPTRKAIGWVHYWPPTIQPVDAAGLPSRASGAGDQPHAGDHTPGDHARDPASSYAAVRLMFELEPCSARSRYVAAFLRAHFDDPRITAADLRITMLRRNSTALDTGAALPTSVSVLRGGGFGWLFGDPEGSAGIPATCGGYVLINVPPGVDVLTCAVRVDATITSPLLWLRGLPGIRREHARAEVAQEFTMRLPDDARRRADDQLTVAGQSTAMLQPAVRLCLAADMERFSRFHTPEATRAQQRFADALARTRRYADLDDAEVQLQRSGDGQFMILPPGLDESVVIPKLVEGLRIALAQTNSDLSEHARLRLRVALHRGHMAPASNGWVGGATIAVHRMLDSDALRNALTAAPAASFALIVPDVLYHEIIVHRYGLLDPDDFTAVNVDLPAKNFTERAWVHVFGP